MEPYSSITTIIALLLVSSVVAMATRWIRVPYTLLLVIVGLLVSPMHFLPSVKMSPDLILLIFLPALLFEAAWNFKVSELRENLTPIVTLATVGVVVSVAIVAAVVHWSIGISWDSALLFGAIISATDPVSVLVVFKKLGAPFRLTAIVEGESLFNDGTAVVIFSIILGFVTGETAYRSAGEIALESLRQFGLVVFGGAAIGTIVGVTASQVTSYFDDHLLEITLTTVAAYGSFLLAEGFHVSPVIAVLAAGLILGNYGRERGMSPTTQIAVNSFWEYAAFVVNSLVFLLIGLGIQLSSLAHGLRTTALAVAATLVARAAVVYGLMPVVNLRTERIPFRWQHVIFWGGLRGSLSIALVLSLPASVSGRQDMVAMVFGTVVFSLLVQGLSIPRLLGWLGIAENDPDLKAYEYSRGRLLAENAALTELDRLHHQGMVADQLYEMLRPELVEHHDEARREISRFDNASTALVESQLRGMRHHLIAAKKARLADLVREGLLSRAAFRDLTEKLDKEISEPHEGRK